MKTFKNLLACGTFDHLHQGHKEFLATAFSVSQRVFCGLTDYQNYQASKDKTLSSLIQNFNLRFKNLKNYLKIQNHLQKTTIFKLKDRFGPALQNNFFDSILVSKKTLEGAKLINQKRKLLGLKPLAIIKADTICDTNHQFLSSSKIRSGKTNNLGLIYENFLLKKPLYLNPTKRSYLQKPLGVLLTGSLYQLSSSAIKIKKLIQKVKPSFVAVVGDITTQTFLLHQIPFNLAILDQKTRRQKHLYLNRNFLKDAKIIKTSNPPATLSPGLVTNLKNIFENLAENQVLQIEGEEDLSVLPSILLSPLKTLIFYGQPFSGTVAIKVTQKTKEKTLHLIQNSFIA